MPAKTRQAEPVQENAILNAKANYKVLTKNEDKEKGVKPNRLNPLNLLVAGKGFEPLTFGL